MPVEMVKIADIIYPRFQLPRVGISEETVEEYAEAMRAGAEFPPVTLYCDGDRLWLSDGLHRKLARTMAGHDDIAADVREGTRLESILHAVGANAEHGLRRTNADKRKCVEIMLRDPEWQQWSDRRIAEACWVSHTFVDEMRKKVGNAATCDEEHDWNRIGRDGKTYSERRKEQQRTAEEEDGEWTLEPDRQPRERTPRDHTPPPPPVSPAEPADAPTPQPAADEQPGVPNLDELVERYLQERLRIDIDTPGVRERVKVLLRKAMLAATELLRDALTAVTAERDAALLEIARTQEVGK